MNWHVLAEQPGYTPGDIWAALEAAGRAAGHNLNRYFPDLSTIVAAALCLVCLVPSWT